MRVLLPGLLLALACTSTPVPQTEAADASTPPDAGPEIPAPTQLGGARPARVIVPAVYDVARPLPLIVLLGGYSYLSSELDDWLGLSKRVDEDRFVLLLPDGTRDLDGEPFWNATETCCDYDASGIDDVAYLRGLLTEAKSRLAIDPTRVYFVGHSNGAFMADRMACEIPAEIAGIGSIAGSDFLDPSLCRADRGVSFLQVHGSADDVMPFAGDDEAPGARELLRRWAERADCDPTSWVEEPLRRDLVDGRVKDETQVGRYGSGCTAGVAVELWRLEGVDHYPEFGAAFTGTLVHWLFAQHR